MYKFSLIKIKVRIRRGSTSRPFFHHNKIDFLRYEGTVILNFYSCRIGVSKNMKASSLRLPEEKILMKFCK